MIRKRAVLLDIADIKHKLREYEQDTSQMPFLTVGTAIGLLEEITGFVVFDLDDSENASVKAIFREGGGERKRDKRRIQQGSSSPADVLPGAEHNAEQAEHGVVVHAALRH